MASVPMRRWVPAVDLPKLGDDGLMAVRSYLRVPAEPAALAGAAGSGADAIVVDLSSTDRLADLRDWLAEADDGPEIWVKLDAAGTDHADLRRVIKAGLSGVCVTGI